MTIDVHHTDSKISYEYAAVIHAHWHDIKQTIISDGHAKCELHNGIVVEADSPEELEEKLK